MDEPPTTQLAEAEPLPTSPVAPTAAFPSPPPLPERPPVPPPTPLPGEARDPLLDALRGAALLPVLAVNLVAMGYPVATGFGAAAAEVNGGWALSLTWLVYLGKGYALLALLYGFGVGAQAARLAASGLPPGPTLRRRFLALGAIGLVHGLFGWYGDILTSYALFGFALLLFLDLSPRAQLWWAGGLLLGAVAVSLLMGGFVQLLAGLPAAAAELDKVMTRVRAEQAADTVAALRAYGEGPYLDLFRRRLGDLAGGLGTTAAMLPQALALFIVGVWCARAGLATDPAWRRRLTGVALALWAVGLPVNVLSARLAGDGLEGGFGIALLFLGAYMLASATLAGAIAATGILLRGTAPVRALTRALAPLGRLSLSAYLLQTLVFANVFYFHGLGLYGKVPSPALLVIAPAFWLLEAALAHLWLARYRLGPAEWLLRRLEYGRAPAMRRTLT